MAPFTTPNLWSLAEDTDDTLRDPDVLSIMAGWAFLAALGWGEYQRRGRGTVMVDPEGRASYHPGSPCQCHQDLVDRYDPEREIVAALYDGDQIRAVHAVAGWPAPPDAALITPAERLHLTAH